MSDADMAVSDHGGPSLDGLSVRLRLDLAYDGTDFSGWAAQPGRRTVQAVLEDALQTVLRVPAVQLTVAGRTDAGVHATGQVAHVDVPQQAWADEGQRLVRRLAGVLPPDVRVFAVAPVPPDFDARFGALWREYEYRLGDRAGGVDPLHRHAVLWWPRLLDESLMRAAAAPLLGLHDFVAFCRRREGASTTRTLQRLDVERRGNELVCTVRADAFCHSMVRSLIGALIAVGERRRPVDWPVSMLLAERRADDVSVAPAHGLTLVHVEYPPDDALADRAETTRARRD
jgi:tRNA pseudouridine38-40 synthase